MLSFIDAAPVAEWFGAAEAFAGVEPAQLDYGMTRVPAAREGFVASSRDFGGVLEDASDAPYLQTHPAWQPHGKIVGIYPPYRVSEDDVFTANVGFLSGARASDGVTFIFGVIPDADRPPETSDFFEGLNEGRLRERFTELGRIDKDYNQRLQPMTVRLGNLAGQTVRPVLIVEAGAGSGQDWAAWSRPVIDIRREIAFTGFQCLLESTSGWSDFRRQRRRSWSSDEFALLVHVLGFDETGSEQRYAGAQFRATSSVDSGESFSFSPMVFGFAPSEVRYLEVRMVGLEIDGAGATDYLAEYAFNSWVGTTFLPGDGTRYSFNSAYYGPRSGNEHNRLAADYWRVDSDRMLSGGVEPPGLWVPPARSPASVEEYLGEIGISRSIARSSFENLTMESRRYRNGPQYSDYVINVAYR